LKFFNHDPIDPDSFFNRGYDRAEKFQIKVRLKFFHQSLLEKIQSRYGCEKLTKSVPSRSGGTHG